MADEPKPPPLLDETLDAKPYEPPRNRFTWLTAVVLLGLGALLYLLLLPPVKRVRPAAPRAACKNNLRQIGIALQLYADDNGGAFPPETASLYPNYVEDPKVLFCWAKRGTWRTVYGTGRIELENPSYVYVAGLGADDPGTCVVAFDRPGNHDRKGWNVLRLDNSVLWINAPAPSEQDQLKAMLDATREAVRKRGGEIRLLGE